MRRRTYKKLKTPIIGKVVALNKYILSKRSYAKKVILYNYIDDLLKQCLILYKYAMRQILNLNVKDLVIEICEEILCISSLISCLGGFKDEEFANIDVLIDSILNSLGLPQEEWLEN